MDDIFILIDAKHPVREPILARPGVAEADVLAFEVITPVPKDQDLLEGRSIAFGSAERVEGKIKTTNDRSMLDGYFKLRV